ncbi:hypothetical protein DQ04_04781030 [Trypanosoma grayi]|uniref:hypothetical protein n=1 Tax=Trypanosoma grayi TaxID=71804 RepID=UPI0004F438B8|nr:hypothetical protein DQ04_04781030 [Trypanosoma grayi]KEG09711.1 hypothetical protein DQ04_04781030 [Trypanosoma grayi]
MEGIEWPPQLLLVVQCQMEQLEHPEVPRTPPLATMTSQRSVLTFLQDARQRVRQRCKASDSVIDCCQNLVLDTIEQCCTSSFLLTKERRLINAAAQQREKRLEGRHGPKRRRADSEGRTSPTTGASTAVPFSYKCAAVLPVEYLLRFFVALPSILAHYDKLGGCAMPAAYKKPLWDYVNAILDMMKDMSFFDPDDYVLLK